MQDDQAHYLKNVLRKDVGDILRIFNGAEGEWLARIDSLSKKNGELALTDQIKPQAPPRKTLHLLFSPIKKQRMDVLIEKAVELGVTDLTPVIMHRTENRKINEDRLNAQIIEAAEQSERLDIPKLHPLIKLPLLLSNGIGGIEVFTALEREPSAKALHEYDYKNGAAFLIGPEGGFDLQERAEILSSEDIRVIDLGNGILRAETAALACLSYVLLAK